MPADRFHPNQRCQALLAGHWHLAQFIIYATIDGREQAIVRTARTLGKPGLLSYLDPRDVRRVAFDTAGNPIQILTADGADSRGSNQRQNVSSHPRPSATSAVNPPLFVFCGSEHSA